MRFLRKILLVVLALLLLLLAGPLMVSLTGAHQSDSNWRTASRDSAGPNSNTFVAWVIRETPELNVALPSHAIGKDYTDRPWQRGLPGGQGFQLSLGGVFGVLAGPAEGLELNLFGLVYGLNPGTPALKIPGLGEWPADNRSERQ